MQEDILTSIKSALVSGAMMAILGIAGYILGVGDFWKVDPHALVNVGGMAALTAIVSFVKNSMTKSDGTVAGIQVK